MTDLTKTVKIWKEEKNGETKRMVWALKHHKENCEVQGEEESEGQAYWQRMGEAKWRSVRVKQTDRGK